MRRIAHALSRRSLVVASAVGATTAPAPTVNALAQAAFKSTEASPAKKTEVSAKVAAMDFDAKTVDVQRLMLVTSQYLANSRRSRLAAQRLLECIQARVDDLPTVFLADISAGAWPTGLFSDSLRVTIRRRVAKGALDLNGADVARVFISWSKPAAQRTDTVLFKRLGKLLAYNINDIRDGFLLCDMLQAIRRAGLKPPPGFLALLARRAVALDRIEPLDVATAIRVVSLLDDFKALDTPTCTAVVNRIVLRLRKSIEQTISARSTDAAAGGAATDEAETPSLTTDAKDVTSDVAALAGLPADVVAAGQRDNDRDDTRATKRSTDSERRDTRWPLVGVPLEDVKLTSREARRILDQHNVSPKRLLSLMAYMQDHALTSLLYSRPLVPLVMPAIWSMHPLEALRWVREGGMKRIVSQRMATAVLAKLTPLDLEFGTHVSILQAFVSFHRHLVRKEKRNKSKENQTAAADGEEPAASSSELDESVDRKALDTLVAQILERMRHIDTTGLQVKPVIAAVATLVELAEIEPHVRTELLATLPPVVERFKQNVDSGAVRLQQCDDFLEALVRLRFDGTEAGCAEALSAIKSERQSAEERGAQSFDCKVQGSKYVFRELVRANAKMAERNVGNVDNSLFEGVLKTCLARHPMSVLEALNTFEQQFPKALAPSLKREVARALIIMLRPGTPASRKETSATPQRAVPLTAEEFPRFVELARTVGPESLVTAPSFWRFVRERNAMLGNDSEIARHADEMLTIFDRRR